MNPATLIRLMPAGPWRFGPGQGGQDHIDTLFRSDRLYSAVTLAFDRLGLLDGWLDATARAEESAVVFSSLFPFQGDTLFAVPPATLWPPPPAAVRVGSPVFAAKIRWRAARFVPVSLIETLLQGQRFLADQWVADAESGCLLRRDRPQASPYRIVTRTAVAVDRLGAGAERHSAACVEFEAGAGLWAIAAFKDGAAEQQWREPLLGALRLLSDTGLGGRRTSGWGQLADFTVQQGEWPALLLPKLVRNMREKDGDEQHHWLLSLFSPGAGDEVDWSEGRYSLAVRGGRVETGHRPWKKLVRMVEEGSVIKSASAPRGTAVDVAPDGFVHPVFRAGFALSVKLPAVTFAAADEPQAPSELEQALGEALKAAAEEGIGDDAAPEAQYVPGAGVAESATDAEPAEEHAEALEHEEAAGREPGSPGEAAQEPHKTPVEEARQPDDHEEQPAPVEPADVPVAPSDDVAASGPDGSAEQPPEKGENHEV